MFSFPVKNYLPNDVIFEEGTKGEFAYLLKEGEVEIFTMIGGRKVVMTLLTPPSIFGEMVLLLNRQKRTASACAVKPTKVLEISRESFYNFKNQSPPFIGNLLEILAQRLQRMTEKSRSVPDIFDGVCHILNLCAFKDNIEIPFNKAVSEMSKAILIHPDELSDLLKLLNELKLIEIFDNTEKETVIAINDRENFIEKAKKMREIGKRVGTL